MYNTYLNTYIKDINIPIHKNLFAGTKECYSGPLDLVESIRIALGDMPIRKDQSSSSEPEHSRDKPLDNRSVQTKDTLDVDNKNDTNAGMQRQKV